LPTTAKNSNGDGRAMIVHSSVYVN
jgi:hypothetical protein